MTPPRGRWHRVVPSRSAAAIVAAGMVLAAALGIAGSAGCQQLTTAGPADQSATRPLHEATDATIGAASTAEGYTFESPVSVLDRDLEYRFRILGPDGRPQLSYERDRPDPVVVYAVRDDLASFAHVRPTMSPDGTWSVHLPLRVPGPYHVYASALVVDTANALHELVLSRPLTLPGPYQLWPKLPEPSTSAQVDGYAIAFDAVPRPWTVTPLGARVTRSGQPPADLEPLDGAYAQLAAIRWPGHLFAHAEPLDRAVAGHAGGPTLTFDVEFPGAGDYRVFVEFRAAGRLHTASLTMRVD